MNNSYHFSNFNITNKTTSYIDDLLANSRQKQLFNKPEHLLQTSIHLASLEKDLCLFLRNLFSMADAIADNVLLVTIRT